MDGEVPADKNAVLPQGPLEVDNSAVPSFQGQTTVGVTGDTDPNGTVPWGSFESVKEHASQLGHDAALVAQGAADQAGDFMGQLLGQGLDFAKDRGPGVLGGIIILILGFKIAGWADRAVRAALAKTKRLEPTLQSFFGSLVRYVIMALVIIAVLNQFGIETTSLIAMLGAAGLAIGLAMQGTLTNIASGVMLIFFRPYRVGDEVEVGGHLGVVKVLSLFTTELTTDQNTQIIIPNNQIWGTPIVNITFHPTHRVDMVMRISFEDDLDKAMAVLRSAIDEEAMCLQDPPPEIWVGRLTESAVELFVWVWATTEDFPNLGYHLTRRFKLAFDAAGITIPYPQEVVHHEYQPANSPETATREGGVKPGRWHRGPRKRLKENIYEINS